MGMTKSEFMSKYINEKYDKAFEKKKKEESAKIFIMERSYVMGKKWRKK